ncbi:MAG: leucine-rich repeat domain-containing protein [Oscillospiraceae bacterium]|nr:leucine-rich repeat domain-containing protein [Oscillospiraceae bacterium]
MFKKKSIAKKIATTVATTLILTNTLIINIQTVSANEYIKIGKFFEKAQTEHTIETEILETPDIEKIATANQVKLIDIFECETLLERVGEALVRSGAYIEDCYNWDDPCIVNLGDLYNLSGELRAWGIQSLNGIEYLPNLTELAINWFGTLDISSLENLENLINLDLNGRINDIYSLSGLTNLRYLRIHGARINDISALSELTNLKILDLVLNEITDISPLSNLLNLESLNMGTNGAYEGVNTNNVKDISPLSNLTNLTELLLEGNQISNISPLSNLTNLEVVNLAGNQISDLRPLSYLSNTFIEAIAQRIVLSPTTIGTNVEFNLFSANGTPIPLIEREGQFTFENQLLTWNSEGDNIAFWDDRTEENIQFSGLVIQQVTNAKTPPPVEVDSDSIEAMHNFLDTNTPDYRIIIPSDATTELEIISAIASALNEVEGLNEAVTVNLIRQENTIFEENQINNITVKLSVNPSYSFTNTTIYFRHADTGDTGDNGTEPTPPENGETGNNNNNETEPENGGSGNNNNNRPTLPQTGAITTSLVLGGIAITSFGTVIGIIKNKKRSFKN